MFKVGEEVVVLYLGRPLSHNIANNPEHRCRGIVLKVGRKNYTIQSTSKSGITVPINPTEDNWITVCTVEEARKIQAENMKNKPAEWIEYAVSLV